MGTKRPTRGATCVVLDPEGAGRRRKKPRAAQGRLRARKLVREDDSGRGGDLELTDADRAFLDYVAEEAVRLYLARGGGTG